MIHPSTDPIFLLNHIKQSFRVFVEQSFEQNFNKSTYLQHQASRSSKLCDPILSPPLFAEKVKNLSTIGLIFIHSKCKMNLYHLIQSKLGTAMECWWSTDLKFRYNMKYAANLDGFTMQKSSKNYLMWAYWTGHNGMFSKSFSVKSKIVTSCNINCIKVFLLFCINSTWQHTRGKTLIQRAFLICHFNRR